MMQSKLLFSAIILALFMFFQACKAPMVERENVVSISLEDYVAGSNLPYEKQPNGSYKYEETTGDPDLGTISSGMVVEARMVVYNLEDQEIDNAVQRFRSLSEALLPRSLDTAMVGLNQGQSVRFLVPSSLAWKSYAFDLLPSDTHLRIDVEVLTVFTPAAWEAREFAEAEQLANEVIASDNSGQNLEVEDLGRGVYYVKDPLGVSAPSVYGRLRGDMDFKNLDQSQYTAFTDSTLYYYGAGDERNNYIEGFIHAFPKMQYNKTGYLTMASSMAYDASVTVVPSFLRAQCAEDGIIAPAFVNVLPFATALFTIEEYVKANPPANN
ncbi:hypothetical protein [Persicobacter sp. CCB-QB2]|uniref:hypothetical protein n=1 Tax=Persicobacter sp. CCB-QB2 TaxID=1561025 RepID=UPI0006A9704A|nr:hypothetical protein [Persicobacter sp. CCB-QB2]